MTRFHDADTDGELIRLVRCPKGHIVGRLYGDCEIRFRLLDAKERSGGRAIVNGSVDINAHENQLAEMAARFDAAQCAGCQVGYDLRDVRAAARLAVRKNKRSVKLLQRYDTL